MNHALFSQRASPVEGLYAVFPFFLYLNATYCEYLLRPILEYASSRLWTYPYPPRDLGELCTFYLLIPLAELLYFKDLHFQTSPATLILILKG